MNYPLPLFVSGLFLAMTAAAACPCPRVDADLKVYDLEVARRNAEFAKLPADPKDKQWVIRNLQHMVAVDQYTIFYRDIIFDHAYTKEERAYFEPIQAMHYQNVVKEHAEVLKDLLKIYEWITISAFGVSADGNAWLLVQHDDQEPAFQKQILPILERLYPKHETSAANYAYLFDRIASHEQPARKQRFGTQGKCVGPATWEPHPIEDAASVDQRRKSLGMVTMAEYKTWFKDLCKE